MTDRTPDRINTTMRLPADLRDRLDRTAEARCVGRNFIIERAIRTFLDALDADPIDQP
jgi:predicted transcriptional regulator